MSLWIYFNFSCSAFSLSDWYIVAPAISGGPVFLGFLRSYLGELADFFSG